MNNPRTLPENVILSEARDLLLSLHCLLVATCLTINALVLQAQPTISQRSDTVTRWANCRDDYKVPGAWSHCALRIEQGRLRQGNSDEVLGSTRAIRPLPLTNLVVGDSALRYAERYHRAEIWHTAFVAAGAALIAGSIVEHQTSGLYAGGGLLAVAIPFRIDAHRTSRKAIDFFNASLGR